MHDADHLSAAELAALQDRDFLPMKHRIGEKLDRLLLDLRDEIGMTLASATDKLPAVVRTTPGKLARGENYKHYAYRLLDMPRVFAGEDMLAFRSLVLWGHEVGFHLMLAGSYLQRYGSALMAQRQAFAPGAWLAAHETPWVWERTVPGYLSLDQVSAETVSTICAQHSYLKISYFLPLDMLHETPRTGRAIWAQWQQLLEQTS
ncbi:MAG: hypothetical protein OHK0039_01840 [Bacteroidia bacterium]